MVLIIVIIVIVLVLIAVFKFITSLPDLYARAVEGEIEKEALPYSRKKEKEEE